MDIKVKDKAHQRHVGRNLQRIRVYLGMKQEALASDLGISQQEISKIEKQDEIEESEDTVENEIEDGLLTKIAEVLGISTDVIKDFDVEKAICNINNYKDATISPGATATVYAAHTQQINPIEKVVELYERLLKSEQEKIEILRECIKQGK